MKTNKTVTHFTTLGLTLILIFTLLTGCGTNNESATDSKANATPEIAIEDSDIASTETPIASGERISIKVGICAGPYEDLFRDAIEPSLYEKGYDIEYLQFSDYVQPNKALADGAIDVNLFQHAIYLNNFSKEHGLDLVYLTEVPTAGMGIFGDNLTTINDLPEGATVALPNDITNLARAIRVLEQAQIVTIDPTVDPNEATQYTLSNNPKNLSFIEIEAPQLPRSLDSVDIAVINGNFAIGAGLNLADALYNEELQEGYLNVIAVRAEDADSELANDIVAAVHSDAFRSVIEDDAKPYTSFFKPANYAQ